MDKVKTKETILTITLGFIALYLAFDRVWLLYVAFATGVTGLFSQYAALVIHKAWMKLADILGYIMSRIILGAVFFLILVPVGALAKIFRKDFMYLKRRPGTYYHERDHQFTPQDFNDPW